MTRQVSSFQGSIKENTDLEPAKLVDTTIDELRAKTMEILRREVTNLMIESSKGKLHANSAKSLTDYIKLLGELKDIEEEELASLKDEHLKKLVEK